MRPLISGAGIAGLTLAWLLAKTGARIRRIEKSYYFLAQEQNVDIMGQCTHSHREDWAHGSGIDGTSPTLGAYTRLQ